MSMRKPWQANEVILLLLGVLGAMSVIGVIILSDNLKVQIVWLVNLCATVFIMLALSKHFQGHWLGLLIDSRNKISLSRLQLVAWSIVILSAIFVALVINARVTLPSSAQEINIFMTGAVQRQGVIRLNANTTIGELLFGFDGEGGLVTDDADLSQVAVGGVLINGDTLNIPSRNLGDTFTWYGRQGNIEIPEEIWALLGISTTSLIGSTLLKGNKDRDDGKNESLIHKNESPDQANLADLVMGEEITNYATLDMAKIQMLYFTIALLLGYGVAIGSMFTNSSVNNPIYAFPTLAPGMIALLGISHAGYLTNKAIPKGGTSPVLVNFQKLDEPLTYQFNMVPIDDTARYMWEFGDGSFSSEKQPVHTYNVPGTYTVCVTARGGTMGIVNADVDVNVT